MQTARALEFIQHTLGRAPGLDGNLILNQAGRHLISMHAWRFQERPDYLLDELAPITITGATWTESSKTLTKTAGFTSYTHRGGDRFNATSGTGVTVGSYRIASKTSANAIVLEQSIGAAADAQTNVAGDIKFPYIQLPPDFRELISIDTTTGLVHSIELTTLSRIQEFRTHSVPITNFVRYLAFEYQTVASPGGAPTPRLAIYGTPTVAAPGVLTLYYRAGWTDLNDDATFIPIPPYVEGLFLQLLAAFAHGLEEREEGSVSPRLLEVQAGPLYMAAVRDDADLEPDIGPMLGGSVMHFGGRGLRLYGPYDYQTLPGP